MNYGGIRRLRKAAADSATHRVGCMLACPASLAAATPVRQPVTGANRMASELGVGITDGNQRETLPNWLLLNRPA